MTIDITTPPPPQKQEQQQEQELINYNDTLSIASTSTTAAPLSAYVDYTPRRNFTTKTTRNIIPSIIRPDLSLETNGVSLSRQHRAHYFHQLAQQENEATHVTHEDYMNTPIVRRYHGITSELVSIKVDMNNNLYNSNKDTRDLK